MLVDGRRARRGRWRIQLQLRAGLRFGVELVDVELRRRRFRIFGVRLRFWLVQLGLGRFRIGLRIVVLWFGPTRRGHVG
jgi:hypothetical protein